MVFPPGSKAAEVVEPGEESLDGPAAAVAAEFPSVLRFHLPALPVRCDQLDPAAFDQFFCQRVAVVGLVADQVMHQPLDFFGDRFERVVDEPDFGGRGAVEGDSQRKAPRSTTAMILPPLPLANSACKRNGHWEFH